MQSFKQKISLLLLILPILFLSAIAAAQYTPPTGTAPANNTEIPVDVSATDQVKAGGLSVNAFTALQNASFNKQLFVSGIMVGKPVTTTQSTLHFGGTDPVTNTTRIVDVAVEGDTKVSEDIYSETLETGSGEKELCAQSDGTIVFCN